ncbi:MAG: discoidin domain-containing protein [Lysobacter sp.]
MTQTQASSEFWPVARIGDGNVATVWSSTLHPDASHREWMVYRFDGFHPVNYIKLKPRYDSGKALGFPTDFIVYWSDGHQWQQAAAHSAFPVTTQDGWIVLPLPAKVSADAIHVVATKLGADDVGNYVFQLAEATAGYDAGFEALNYLGNNGASLENEIANVGSGPFDAAKLSNWNYDVRRPFIAPQPGGFANIYAPSVVKNGGTWNIYFGGWDGTGDQHDRISIVTTEDFDTMSPHQGMIDSASYLHANNPSVLRLGEGAWRMCYTSLKDVSSLNRTMCVPSTNGIDWSPNEAQPSALIAMNDYPGWNAADVNGANVLYHADGTYMLYFIDFKGGHGVPYAASTDGKNFYYQGMATTDHLVINDFKAFGAGSTKQYMAAFHLNGDRLWYSVGQSLTQFPSAQTLFPHYDAADRYITSVGLVTDGARLYGALYGAGADVGLASNRIFAAWLQKKVIFESERSRWGDIEGARGPDKIVMRLSSPVETGRYAVYDTDGTTLLYRSPLMTIRSGDIWRFAGP